MTQPMTTPTTTTATRPCITRARAAIPPLTEAEARRKAELEIKKWEK